MIAAIVPAAGRSSRMGQPKLLLEIEGVPLIARVVAALRAGGASPVVVVCPPGENSASGQIKGMAIEAGAVAIVPECPTPDMRSSFVLGLEWLAAAQLQIGGVILAPADSPGITDSMVQMLISGFDLSRADFVVPVFDGRRGHPLLMTWLRALQVRDLPAGRGINELLRLPDAQLCLVEVPTSGVLLDLDTPDDYRRLAAMSDSHPPGSPQA